MTDGDPSEGGGQDEGDARDEGGTQNETSPSLTPDEAFSALGDETRLSILQALGEADDPLTFSALRERVGSPESSRFNYHLGELTGHFVEKDDEGYDLRRAGEHVVEAVLSGAVTEDPEMSLTRIEEPCPRCGADVAVRFREERLTVFCTGCEGIYGGSGPDPDDERVAGYNGYLSLPPAGIDGRTPAEVHRSAQIWQLSELLPAANDVCPRCAATLEQGAEVCEDHDADDGVCDACGRNHAVSHLAECTNCIYDQRGALLLWLLSETEVLAFLTAHDVNPVAPSSGRYGRAVMDYEEAVHDTDPLDVTLTVGVDGDRLSVRVDDDLEVVDVERA